MRKERSSSHGKELPMSLVNSTKVIRRQRTKETEQENGENENEISIDVNTNEMTRIPRDYD